MKSKQNEWNAKERKMHQCIGVPGFTRLSCGGRERPALKNAGTQRTPSLRRQLKHPRNCSLKLTECSIKLTLKGTQHHTTCKRSGVTRALRLQSVNLIAADDNQPHDDGEVDETVQRLVQLSSSWPAQLSEDWFAARKQMLTASDVSAVIGTNFYTTPERLLNKKLGIEAPEKLNAALRHGNFYEAEARRLYEEKTGEKCVEFGLKPHDRYFTLPSRLEVP